MPAHKYTPDERIAAFWKRVDKSGGADACWIWMEGHGRDKDGYGVLKWLGKTRHSNRIAYEISFGEIPAGMQVLHHCDNPPCVNPAHLFLGTNLDNAKDRNAKRRQAYGERNATAVLTEEIVREIRRRYVKKYGIVRQIAHDLGLNYSTVHAVCIGVHWKHVK